MKYSEMMTTILTGLVADRAAEVKPDLGYRMKAGMGAGMMNDVRGAGVGAGMRSI